MAMIKKNEFMKCKGCDEHREVFETTEKCIVCTRLDTIEEQLNPLKDNTENKEPVEIKERDKDIQHWLLDNKIDNIVVSQTLIDGDMYVSDVLLKYVNKQVKEALETAFDYSQIDGGHHKMWVIDQMVRKLLVTEEAYKAWITNYKTDEDGDEFEWDEGIAP